MNTKGAMLAVLVICFLATPVFAQAGEVRTGTVQPLHQNLRLDLIRLGIWSGLGSAPASALGRP